MKRLFSRAGQSLGLVAAAALVVAAAHITPTVVLKKRADVIRQSLPGAQKFFVRSVEVGRQDADRIKRQAGFTPEDPKVKFYYGTDPTGAVDGVIVFPQVNTQHGPFELGLTFGPQGAITSAVMTKATVETKPWVKKVVDGGLMERFEGMRPGDDVRSALQSISKDEVGAMPYYVAEVITTAVGRGLALYQVLYASQ